MAISVTATAIALILSFKSVVLTQYPSSGRNPDLDLVFNAYSEDFDDDESVDEEDLPGVAITILGSWYNKSLHSTFEDDNSHAVPITVSISAGTGFAGWVETGIINITIAPETPWAYTEPVRTNWIKWSNIGSLDFTIWKDNIAGERPADWSGYVHRILKLGGKVVVYGQNGVSLLTPVGSSWGMQTFPNTSVVSQLAVDGTNSVHWFIDSEYRLFELSDSLKELGYDEYLSVLTRPTLSYDAIDKLLYICDGTYGFVYNPAEQSLCSGPVGITGLGYKSGVRYIASDKAIVTPTVSLCTDILDFGTRKPKSIHSVEVGTNLTAGLYACVEHRRTKGDAFVQSDWRYVNDKGVARINCYGSEFRIRLSTSVYEDYEIDYITVNGEIHS